MADKGSPGLRLEAMFAVIRRTQCSNRKTVRLVAFGSSMVAQSSYENPVVRGSTDSVPDERHPRRSFSAGGSPIRVKCVSSELITRGSVGQCVVTTPPWQADKDFWLVLLLIVWMTQNCALVWST